MLSRMLQFFLLRKFFTVATESTSHFIFKIYLNPSKGVLLYVPN